MLREADLGTAEGRETEVAHFVRLTSDGRGRVELMGQLESCSHWFLAPVVRLIRTAAGIDTGAFFREIEEPNSIAP
jgi:hypothetical protein